MSISSTPIHSTRRAFVLLALCSSVAEAGSLNLTAARIHDPNADAQGVSVILEEHADAGSLTVRAARLEVPALALEGRLDWACTLLRAADGSRTCAGKAAVETSPGVVQEIALTATVDGRHIGLALAREASRATFTIPLADDVPASASLQQIPVEWLKAPIARAWTGGELSTGRVDVDASRDHLGRIDVRYAASGLSFNTADGTVAGAGMNATGKVTLTGDATTSHVVADSTLTGGSFALGAVRVTLPATPVNVDLDADVGADGIWNVDRFAWRDPDTLSFEASGAFAPAATAPLRSLRVSLEKAAFPQASTRYVDAALASYGVASPRLRGDLAGTLSMEGNALGAVSLISTGLDLDDRTRGIEVRGIHGGIDWAATGDRPAQAFGWKSANIQGLSLSAAVASWASKDGTFQLRGPLRLKMMGGSAVLGNTVLHPLAAQGERVRTDFSLEGIGYDSADARLAASKVVARGRLRVSADTHALRLQAEARLEGGEFLADPMYVKLPATPVNATIDASLAGAVWRIDRLDWNDPGVLAFGASGEWAPGDPKPLRTLRIDLREAALGAALDRYARAWAASRGYGQLEAGGSLSGRFDFGKGGLQRFSFVARAVDLKDAGGRFALSGIEGGVDWDAQGEAPATTLGWNAVELYRVPFGPMKASLQSREGRVVLADPVDVGVLGGKVRIEKLSLQPDSPRGERYAGSFGIAAIDMTQLSTALGWPKFPGNLSGGIPEIEFVGDRLELHGGLDLYVFDGRLGISGMSLEHPFSDLPALAADVHFENFDLQQLTSAFSFGGMSGRLSGTIDRLSLLNWRTVAFDAWLRTVGGGRMSYKAISDVTAVAGGGGLSDNMQTIALKLVNTFGYGRLGFRCRLADDVCTMGGIDPAPADRAEKAAGDDYTIVEGAGLPRISIVGHRRRVDWPTLVRRVDAAVQGQAPVIQ